MNIHNDSAKMENLENPSQDFDDFVYLISHDIRNSVRALIELPQWITEDLVNSGQRLEGSLAENISLMNTHTRRLDRMLNDLLVYSRIGRMQSICKIDLTEAIERITEEIRIPPNIKLVLDLRHGTLEIGEKDAMTLLTALISNAVRHRDEATSFISIACEHDDGVVVLKCQDDGPGIPLQYREKAFRAMTTLKSRDEVEGSGMGLAHIRKIICHYGASLRWMDLNSTRGVGLEIRFPARPLLPTAAKSI